MQKQNKFLNFLGIAKKSGKLIEGYNSCEEEIKRNKVFLCILSKEVSENTKKKFKKYCEDNKVLLIAELPCESIGRAIGREKINVLAVKDEIIANNLMKLWKENYEM